MEYKHFSHPHNLRIYQVQAGDKYLCSGCDSLCSGQVYGCWDCKFFLHDQCGNANRSMTHQSHPHHHLTLVPYTTYSPGTFVCNACGESGTAFSYCCPLCDFDLHVPCALLPQMIKHEAHWHELSLDFGLQSNTSSSHLCGVCHKVMDGKFWSYNCFACNFSVHVGCVSEKKRKEKDRTGLNKEESDCGSTSEGRKEEEEIEDPVLRTQVELQRLQLEMEMAQALANMMASFNLSSLV